MRTTTSRMASDGISGTFKDVNRCAVGLYLHALAVSPTADCCTECGRTLHGLSVVLAGIGLTDCHEHSSESCAYGRILEFSVYVAIHDVRILVREHRGDFRIRSHRADQPAVNADVVVLVGIGVDVALAQIHGHV